MTLPILFAAEAAGEHAEVSGLEALGISPQAFIVQLLTFIFVFLLLKRFAFGPITRLLVERRKVIDDGVRMGLKMEKEKAQQDKKIAQITKDARHEADQIISAAHKEARQIQREAEKEAKKKADRVMDDAEVRLKEESVQARKHLEKELVKLVSDATEAMVSTKVDKKRDIELVKNALKGQKK